MSILAIDAELEANCEGAKKVEESNDEAAPIQTESVANQTTDA